MHNYRSFESMFFKYWGLNMKIGSVVCSGLSLNFFLNFNFLHRNEFVVLDFGKEIYVEMERQYLNKIFHCTSSRWLRKNVFPTIAFVSRLVRP